MVNREERRLFFQFNLCNIDNSSHDKTMLAWTMSTQLAQSSPVLEPTICSLMPCSSNLLHALIKVVQSTGCLGMRQPLADSIRKVTLPRLHSILQTFLQSNLLVSKSATRKRTIQPNNVSGLDRNTNFASNSSMVKLVRAPTGFKRKRLLDNKISSIDDDQASRSIGSKELILPSQLCSSSNKTSMSKRCQKAIDQQRQHACSRQLGEILHH